MFDATKLPPLSEAGPKFVSFVKALPQQLDSFGTARDAVMKAVSPATAALVGKVARKTPLSVHAATFSSGFVLGAAAAAFVTPMSGPELRATIRRQFDAWWNRASDEVDVDVPTSDEASQRASEAAVEAGKKVTDIENATKRATRETAGKVVDAVESAADATRERIAKTAPDEALEELSKDELYERAQAAGIDGRSQMDKDQLLHALQSQLN